MTDTKTSTHPGPGYSSIDGPKAPANVPGGIPTKEEFVKAGYAAEGYDAFVAERTKQLGGK